MTKSIEQFIEEARKIHGEKYNYSKVDYKNNKTKVEIICPKHGSFYQQPKSHLQKNGCAKCKTKSLNDFLEQAYLKHKSKYDYSKVDYKNKDEKIEIICRTHGSFLQAPYAHLRGQGCSSCKFDEKRLGKDEFIRRSKLVHGDKYDYSCVEFSSVKEKVKIICNNHGEFNQIAHDHQYGVGCPKCKSSKGEKAIREILKKYNISFLEQKEFEDCKYIRVLPFDFLIEEKKMLIEFQGEHHFPPKHKGRMYGASNPWGEYELIVKRDVIKKDWCEKNNYNLICISYKDIKKIDLILKKELGLD